MLTSRARFFVLFSWLYSSSSLSFSVWVIIDADLGTAPGLALAGTAGERWAVAPWAAASSRFWRTPSSLASFLICVAFCVGSPPTMGAAGVVPVVLLFFGDGMSSSPSPRNAANPIAINALRLPPNGPLGLIVLVVSPGWPMESGAWGGGIGDSGGSIMAA